MNKVKLELGDPSNDGHGRHDDVIILTNKTASEISEAYLKSCQLTGLTFDSIENTGLKNLSYNERQKRSIAVDYEESTISKLAELILLAHGIDVWRGFEKEYFAEDDVVYVQGVNHFTELWFDFVKLSLPDLTYEIVGDDDIPSIRGNFGYGLYS